MNQTPTPPSANDDEVKTRGIRGQAIYDVLSNLVSAPQVLTFDGKPYDAASANKEYATLTLDGTVYGYLEQPDETTTWFYVDGGGSIWLMQSDVADALQLEVASEQPMA